MIQSLSDHRLDCGRSGSIEPFMNTYSSGSIAITVKKFTVDGDPAGLDIITCNPSIHDIDVPDEKNTVAFPIKQKDLIDVLADAHIITLTSDESLTNDDGYEYFTATVNSPSE
jgi:hypothetical protein